MTSKSEKRALNCLHQKQKTTFLKVIFEWSESKKKNYKKPFVDFLAFKVNHSNKCYNSYSLIVPLAQKLFFPFLATSIPRPLHSARTFRNVVFCFWCKQLWGFFSDFSPFCGLTSTSTLWKKEISRANVLTLERVSRLPLRGRTQTRYSWVDWKASTK